MEKNARRVLTFFLVIVLTVSYMCMEAFAANADNVKQYGDGGGYLAIGDSICRGLGSDGYYDTDTEKATYSNYDF